MRRSVRSALCLAVAVGALVLGSAAPGSAASARSTSYAASWSSTGNVSGNAGGLTLVDYAGTTYYDRVIGSPSTPLSVDGVACARGNAFQTGLSVYGADEAWAQMPVGSTMGARVEIACLVNGVLHRYHWGNRVSANSGYLPGSCNCVTLGHPTTTTFSLTAGGAGCLAQDETQNSRGTQLSSSERDVPFSATVTVAGLH